MSEGLTMNQLAEKNALLATENAALQQRLDESQALVSKAALQCAGYANANMQNLERAESAEARVKSAEKHANNGWDLAEILEAERDLLQKKLDALAADREKFAVQCAAAKIAVQCAQAAGFECTLNTPDVDAYFNSVRAGAIPEGYVLAPQQMYLSADAMESLCYHCGDGGFAFGEFTDGILWVGDIENDDGTKTYGLNIATAEYPEEGSANISEFAAQLRAGEAK